MRQSCVLRKGGVQLHNPPSESSRFAEAGVKKFREVRYRLRNEVRSRRDYLPAEGMRCCRAGGGVQRLFGSLRLPQHTREKLEVLKPHAPVLQRGLWLAQ
mgnify:CR=1 FL=1